MASRFSSLGCISGDLRVPYGTSTEKSAFQEAGFVVFSTLRQNPPWRDAP